MRENKELLLERLSLALPYSPTEFAIHSLRYLPLRGAVAGKRVLDIACGEGLGTSLLSSWGADQVIGVDIAAEAISAAKVHSAHRGKAQVEFICADAFRYLEEVTEDFDLIISAETIEHLTDPRRFLELCKSRLTSDGSLIVSCPNDTYYYGSGQTMNRYHLASYRFTAFRELAEAVLGQGSWAFGAPLNGFGLFPQTSTDVAVDNYRDALARRRHLSGEVAPITSSAEHGLTPENALFYLGIWGSLPLRGAFGVAIPFSSDHRMSDMRSVSDDVSQGVVRRMALVHDHQVTQQEIASLSYLLREKYAIEPIAWTGSVEALADEVLNGNSFDNIHFEAPQAFDALADWVSRAALTPGFAEADGVGWSTATLTLRPDLHLPTSHNLDFADGTFGRVAAKRSGRTVAGHRAVLWEGGIPKVEIPESSQSAPPHRIAVIMSADPDSASVKALLATAHVRLPELVLCPVEPDLSLQQIASRIAGADALLCTNGSGAARRAAAEAIGHGLAVILPYYHPLAPLLGDAQKPLIMPSMDAASLTEALQRICQEPETRARIRVENLALADHMATPARGIAWTRTLAQAQLACQLHGAPLRAAALKAAAQAASLVRSTYIAPSRPSATPFEPNEIG